MTDKTDKTGGSGMPDVSDDTFNDNHLRESIINELDWDARIDATHVCVTIEDGTVTLTGYVNAYPEIFQVRDAVCRLRGVRAIADELHVQIRATDQRDDSVLSSTIATIIESIVNVADSRLQASVRSGSVLLTGEVDWQHQRKQLEDQVAWVKGVNSVINRVELRKRPAPEDLKNRIEAALGRNAELERTHVTVTVEDDEVILSGQVKAFYERQLVEATAWQAPGVKRIIDRIQVV